MKVAVVQGGPSPEAAVSRASGQCVAAALSEAGHEVERIELSARLPGLLSEFAPDVVYPAVHGAQGEDGCLQGLLEVLRLKYVGSDVRASAIAADKIASKLFFRRSGLPVAKDRIVKQDDLSIKPAELLAKLRKELGPELIVKPAQGGSTIGISRVLAGCSHDEFRRALSEAQKIDPNIFVEQYVRGLEVTCSVLERKKNAEALPLVSIQATATEWYDFKSKYAPEGSLHECPAPLSKEMTKRVQDMAVEAHLALGARDVSRSDFIVDPKIGPVLLELNTLPGMTETSLLPDAARAAGLSFSRVVDSLVRRAAERPMAGEQEGRPLPLR